MSETLLTTNFESIISSVNYPSTLVEKIDRVLEDICSKTDFFKQTIEIDYNDYPLFFCKDENELISILKYLEQEKYIESSMQRDIVDIDRLKSIYLLPEGIKRIEELSKNAKSDQCFVAMWFNDDKSKGPNIKDAYNEAIEPAIKDKENSFKPYRVDIDQKNIDFIPDKIIKEIRRSRFMIADLTGYRGGVYYEAGFAEGLGLKVIYACNKKWFEGWIKQCECPSCSNNNGCKMEDVHFDLKQKSMILWEEDKLPEFKLKLTEKIGAVVGVNDKA